MHRLEKRDVSVASLHLILPDGGCECFVQRRKRLGRVSPVLACTESQLRLPDVVVINLAKQGFTLPGRECPEMADTCPEVLKLTDRATGVAGRLSLRRTTVHRRVEQREQRNVLSRFPELPDDLE